jgi:hypothetical protein
MTEQMALRQVIALVANFIIPDHVLHISSDHIDRYNKLVADAENILGEGYSLERFKIASEHIKPEMKREYQQSELSRFGIRGGNRPSVSVFTGNHYCERAVFESQLNSLFAFLKVMLTPPEQDAVKKAKIGF